MWTFAELEALAERGESSLEACLLPLEAGMDAWPRVEVGAADAGRLGHGQDVEGVFAAPGEVAMFGPGGRVLGLGTADGEGGLRPRRMFAWACAQPGTGAAAG